MKTNKSAVLRPSVYGRLIDRYLFNFRIAQEILEKRLPPINWLKPRIINGSGVVSFCLLRLEGVTVWPIPSFLGANAISCAYRCAVVDNSGPRPEPSVYVLGRNTNLATISRLGSALFSGPMKRINTNIEERPSLFSRLVDIRTSYLDGRKLFSAKVEKASSRRINSKLFSSLDDFVDFIKGGLSSYTPSTRQNHYSRVDLQEDSNYYEPVVATIDYNWLEKEWPDSGLVFDSAFHAGGGLYKLKYLGLQSSA